MIKTLLLNLSFISLLYAQKLDKVDRITSPEETLSTKYVVSFDAKGGYFGYGIHESFINIGLYPFGFSYYEEDAVEKVVLTFEYVLNGADVENTAVINVKTSFLDGEGKVLKEYAEMTSNYTKGMSYEWYDDIKIEKVEGLTKIEIGRNTKDDQGKQFLMYHASDLEVLKSNIIIKKSLPRWSFDKYVEKL